MPRRHPHHPPLHRPPWGDSLRWRSTRRRGQRAREFHSGDPRAGLPRHHHAMHPPRMSNQSQPHHVPQMYARRLHSPDRVHTAPFLCALLAPRRGRRTRRDLTQACPAALTMFRYVRQLMDRTSCLPWPSKSPVDGGGHNSRGKLQLNRYV